MQIASFMARPVGRLARAVIGLILIFAGIEIRGVGGVILVLVGLVFVAVGAVNVCLLAPLLGAPLSGSKCRRA